MDRGTSDLCAWARALRGPALFGLVNELLIVPSAGGSGHPLPPLEIVATLLDAALLGLAFTPPLAAGFDRRIRLRHVVLVAWVSSVAIFVVMLLLIRMVGLPAAWNAPAK